MSLNTTIKEIDNLLEKAQEAFFIFKNFTVKQRAAFMHQVADAIEALDDELITTAQAETNLPVARLQGEKGRTVGQWRGYADALASGVVLPVRIDTALPDRQPAPRPSIRKTYTPLGPVVVFCASNFPFAFSTAGGDTASAIAAGCPVIVKAHSAHPKTSGIMAAAINGVIQKAGLPEGLFGHVYSNSFENGTYLVSHPVVKAVGFTGSHGGGKALFDLANKRAEPIPVFAEMGSVNPVFLLEQKLNNAAEEVAKQYAASLTLGVGQFCTNPGIFVAPESPALATFINTLAQQISATPAAPMLHKGIAAAYHTNKTNVLQQPAVEVVAQATEGAEGFGNAAIAITTAADFIANKKLSQEVFGPFGLLVTYKTQEEAAAIAKALEGQLTISIFGETEELANNKTLINIVESKCGRLLFNNFPTGVEVCYAMTHSGPYPSCSDSRFTAVGPDAIKRFARPVSYQNWPDALLPDELKDENVLGVWRTVNGELTKENLAIS